MSKKSKAKTVSEKVTDLILNKDGSGSSDESEEEAPKVVDFDDEEYDIPKLAKSSEFRKKNVKLLSEQSSKYSGKITTRKEMEEEFDSSEDDVTDEDDSEENDDDLSQDDEEESGDEALQAFKNKLQSRAKTNVNGRKATYTEDSSDNEEEDEELEADSDEDGEYDQSFNNKLQKTKNHRKSKKIAQTVDSEDELDDDNDSDDSEQVEQDENSEDEQDNDDDGFDLENDEDDNDADIITETNREAEVQKGLSVQNQLRVWEKMLELRIQTQKLLTKANQLNNPDELAELQTQKTEYKEVALETKQNLSKLLQSMLTLQHSLISQNSEMKSALKRKPPPSDEAPTAKRIAAQLANNFNDFRAHRNDVLLKWDDRTKLLTPGAGNKKKSLQDSYDIIKKIDSALANKHALIEKSQTIKNTETPAEEDDVDEEDTDIQLKKTYLKNFNPNIYDDSDFYHQQLRELIEYKAAATDSISEVTKQYVELQQLRQKMKKKVDTRASKGRKLRYIVHNKLMSFMAPDETATTWTNESINELCKSLFAT